MSAREEAEGPQGDLFARFLQRLHRRGTDQGWTGLNIKIKVTGLLKLLATLQAAVRSLRATPTYVRPLSDTHLSASPLPYALCTVLQYIRYYRAVLIKCGFTARCTVALLVLCSACALALILLNESVIAIP